MSPRIPVNDINDVWHNSLKYLETVGNEIVNETKNPNDKYHVGQLLLKSFRSHPDHVLQIDANTGQSETNESFSSRTIRAALGLRSRGLKHGDVVAIMGPNHLHLTVPLIACQYEGIIADPLDKSWKEMELTASLSTVKPKLLFCQHAYTPTLKTVIKKTGISCNIITFDTNDGEFENFDDFLAEASEESIQNFTPAKFDPKETIALLYSTSGTTGMSKSAAVTHKSLSIQLALLWNSILQYPHPVKKILILSPLQWLSGSGATLACCLSVITVVRTSAETVNVKLIMEIINHFKPQWAIITPALVNMITHHPDVDKYDLTSLKVCHVGGMALHPGILEQLTEKTKGMAYCMYGSTESGGYIFNHFRTKTDSMGKPHPFIDVKLVDPKTEKELGINELGELVFKSEYIFKEYYNSPEATKAAFTEDGYAKSGDIFYRDAEDYFYFVDREKCLLKYNSYQAYIDKMGVISYEVWKGVGSVGRNACGNKRADIVVGIAPSELEILIKTLPGIINVVVTGVPHPDCGEVIVAFVVRSSGAAVSENDVIEVVAKNLAPSKKLRGGVRFVESLPMTSTGKVDRTAVKELAKRTFDVSSIKLD